MGNAKVSPIKISLIVLVLLALLALGFWHYVRANDYLADWERG